jgi:PEP-CTERM motif
MKTTTALLAAAGLSLSIAAHASAITFVFSGTGADLTLGSSAYNDVNISVTLQANTSNLTEYLGSIPDYENLVAAMSISGGPTVTFAGYVFVNQSNQLVGLGSNTPYQDVFDLNDPGVGLNTYGLTTAFGPISTSNVIGINQWSNLSTSGGSLTVSSVEVGTFQAVTSSSAPEPGTLGLLGIGLAGIMLVALRRQGRADLAH